MKKHLSRRKFLLTAGIAGSGWLLSKFPLNPSRPSVMASEPVTAPSQTSVTATTTAATRVRTGPGTEFQHIDTIPKNVTVPVYGRNDASDWIYHEYNGKRGWSAAWLFIINGSLNDVPVVDPNNPPEPEPTPEPDPESPPPDPPAAPPSHWDGSPLGRILLNVMTIYAEPSWKSDYAGSFFYNDVVTIYGAVTGEGLYSTNNTWLQVDGGYIYSSWVQPVNGIQSNPTLPIGEGGAWGVITVPITYSRNGPGDEYPERERLYYSQVQRIIAAENDYYLASEVYGNEFWLKAAYVRIIPPEEIAPISPHVAPEAKRIEISVGEQTLRAYEGEQVAYQVLVSTGTQSSQTPFGEFRVRDKRHGQRMTGGLTGGGYNLAGVPWICYFTNSWIAMHGTYWHNDYGRRHSNGCVNLHPATAQWIFRWTTPVANYWDYHTVPTEGQPGTRVIVKW